MNYLHFYKVCVCVERWSQEWGPEEGLECKGSVLSRLHLQNCDQTWMVWESFLCTPQLDVTLAGVGRRGSLARGVGGRRKFVAL